MLTLSNIKASYELRKSTICGLRQNTDCCDWEVLSRFYKLSEDFIIEFQNNVVWKNILMHQELSEPFIVKIIKDKVVFDKITNSGYSDDEFWNCILGFQKLSEDFIKEFIDKIDSCWNWNRISLFQELSEEFIKEFADKVYWYNICSKQKLSEEFIIEFADRICWESLSANNCLTDDLIIKFYNKLNWNYLLHRNKINKNVIDQLDRHKKLYLLMNWRDVYKKIL